MKNKVQYKVPNGKLVKIQVSYDDHSKKIESISITGDFFAYPEEAIEDLETHLHDIKLDQSILNKTIQDFIDDHHVQFIGLDAESLTKTILMGCV